MLVGTAGSWAQAGDRFGLLTPFLAAGFGAQVLLGALSYLVPVALGGGASPVRAANAVLDRGGALRVAAVNAGLLVCALPVPSLVRVAASVVVLAALAAFVPLLFLAIGASRRAKRAGVPAAGPLPPRPRGQATGLAAVGAERRRARGRRRRRGRPERARRDPVRVGGRCRRGRHRRDDDRAGRGRAHAVHPAT